MMRLLYVGPSVDTLYTDYASRGRVDAQAPVRASREILIAAPADTVWALLSDPRGWGRIDPAIHDVELDGEVRAGTRFTWRNGRARMRSRFAVVEPGREITWTGVSMGIRAVHRHVLHARDDEHTRLVSEESMAAPFLPLIFGSGRLEATLDRWVTAIRAAAEGARP